MAGGFIGGFNPLDQDPIKYSGKWNLKEQLQAIAAGRWTGVPLYELYAWGSNNRGQIGDGTVLNKSSPVQVGNLTNWFEIAVGRNHTAAIKTDGTLWAWGQNNARQVGDGTSVYRSSPVQVGALTSWTKISAGNQHTAAIKTDGTLWTWGNSADGQIGDGTRTLRSSPVQVGALTNWLQVSAGAYHSMSIKTDGTLWAWGRNMTNGQLGDGTVVSRSSPVQVGVLTNWSRVQAGGLSSISTKTDGTLWAWGRNSEGQIGDGTTVHRSSPVQIGALTTWSQAVSGMSHSAAIKTDGTLWAWGAGSSGQLGGGGENINKSSPIQVGALTNWSQVATADRHTVAVKTDGTMWAWGYNTQGRLGDGTVVNKSSPIQIGTATEWSKVALGPTAEHSVATLQGATN
jgi:alpha-tubulin suppressor-like RCC1 family protein